MAAPVTLDALITSVRSAAPAEPLAQLAEASRLRDEVGELTDALLGHFVDQARRGGCSWSQIGEALGVSKQAAQQRTSARELPRERVTPRTQQALERAVELARLDGRSEAGTEHLLLGILAVGESLGAKLLVELGYTTTFVRGRLEEIEAPGAPTERVPGLTPAAARVVMGALEQALLLGHNYVGTEHVLLSLAAEPEGIVAAWFAGGGDTHESFRARIVEILQGLAPS